MDRSNPSKKKVLRSFRLPAELDVFLRSFAKKLQITDSDVLVRCLESVRATEELSVEAQDIRVPGGYRLEVAEYPLPDNVEGIVSLIRSALNQGGCQEIVLRLGQPVRISRLSTDDSRPLDLFQIGDVAADIRNLDNLIEIDVEGKAPSEATELMMSEVLSRGLTPRGWACYKDPKVVPFRGVAVYESEDIPKDALVLLASPDGVDRLTFGVKISYEWEQ